MWKTQGTGTDVALVCVEAKMVRPPRGWSGVGTQELKDVGLPLYPHVLEGIGLAVPVPGQRGAMLFWRLS